MSYYKKKSSTGYKKKSSTGYKKKSSTGYKKKSSTGYKKKSSTNSKSNKQAYVYSLNLKNGKKYVGMTQNLEKRMGQHFLGKGAKWTQKNKPVSINHVQKCKSYESAKKAETIVYKKMRDYHGIKKVRGAGHTKSY
jgi:putative endonuclease